MVLSPGQRHGQPDAITEFDPVDVDGFGVAGLSGVRVAVDPRHPESKPLVEAQVVKVGGSSGYQQGLARLSGYQVDRRLHERSSDAAALVAHSHCHVLDLALPGAGPADDLDVADDVVLVDGDEHPAEVEVGIELRA